MYKSGELQEFLNLMVDKYNRPSFIINDPITIPHQFTQKKDIEIMGFWSAILAWGQRKTIINKSNQIIDLMDGAPYQFISQHQLSDLAKFKHFKHRTFNLTDTLYFIHFFNWYYSQYESLENAFLNTNQLPYKSIKDSILNFHNLFFSLPDYPQRTKKHIATPENNSSCKRINMFLRWMVRKDTKGVDFGIWTKISPASLICPCDIHVDRVARKLGLITRNKPDWLTAEELTNNLKKFDQNDPVKYDFALFGMGVEKLY